MKNISIIVAIAENNAIGFKNNLLCYLPNDLKWFKKQTSGYNIIMGKKTYLSLPKGALPNRTNIVLTSDKTVSYPNCKMANNIEEAITLCSKDKLNFVIGGASIYKQFLPFANQLFLTKIHSSFEADTFFPEIDFNNWIEIEKKHNLSDTKNKFEHTFSIFKKKN